MINLKFHTILIKCFFENLKIFSLNWLNSIKGLYIPGSVAKGIFNLTKMSMKGMNILCPAGRCEWQLLKPDRNLQGFQRRSVDTDCIAHAPLKTQSKMHLTASQLLIHIYAQTDAILIALLKKKPLVLKQRNIPLSFR